MARAIDQPDGLGRYCEQVLRHLLVQDPQTRYIIFLRSDAAGARWREFANEIGRTSCRERVCLAV